MRVKPKYEKIWKKYWVDSSKEKGPSVISRKRIILKLIKKVNPKNKKIIDIGCGSGYLISEIKKEFKKNIFFGADISETAISIARKKYPSNNFQIFDICNKKELPKEKFDIVILEEVLEHIRDDVRVLKNINFLLRKKSYLILSVPFGKKNWSRSDELLGHFRRYEKRGLRSKLLKAGFRKNKIFDWGYPCFSIYYDLLIKKTDPKKLSQVKAKSKRIATKILNNLFKIDDIFLGSGKGRRLFSISKKE
jgi:2-polyprenyl-3-methyl-5-hydroxy-6-metoxy-1,4-benzoquinol methylase